MRRGMLTVAVCTAAVAGTAYCVLDLRFVREEPAAPPDLAWLPPVASVPAPRVRRITPFAEGPCRFEPNRGQSPAAVRFVRRGPGHAMFLEDDAFTSVVTTARNEPTGARAFAYRVRFEGATANPVAVAEAPQPGRTNYFTGPDESTWVLGVPSYARVRYANVWPGIDVLWHGRDGALEYDFDVAPGADPGRVVLAIEGAETCRIDAAGDLVLTGAGTEMRHRRPRILQETASGPREIAGSFVMTDATHVRIDVGPHDPSLPLRIDPVVGIRAGGNANDSVAVVAVSKEDLVGLAGQTPSVTFLPSVGALFATGKGASDAFATTFDVAGASPVAKHTAIVGSAGDECFTDAQFGPEGTLFLVGFTTSASGYPTVRAPQISGLGGQDGTFVAIVPSGAELAFSGGIGGSSHDLATSIALAPSPSLVTVTAAFVGMVTVSNDVPLLGTPAISSAPGQGDGVILKFTPAGVATAGTYVGGSGDDATEGLYLALAHDQGVACAFSTRSPLQTTPGAFQTGAGGGQVDGFAMKFNSTLGLVTASSFVSGSGADFIVSGIAAGPRSGYVVCGTHSTGVIPVTPNATPQVKPGQSDGVLFDLSENFASASLVTFVGGPSADDVRGVVYPTTATAYVMGTGFQGRVPVGGGDAQHGSFPDLFVQHVPLDGAATPFVTNIGSSQYEVAGAYAGDLFSAPVGRPLAVSPGGVVFVAGTTPATAPQFPELFGAVGGGNDVFARSVTLTPDFVAGTGVAFDMALSKADLTDSPKPLKDVLRIAGSFQIGDPIDFTVGGPGSFALTLAATNPTATATIVQVDVPLTDPNWRASKNGDVLSWSSPKGALPVMKFAVDLASETFKADLSKIDLPNVGILPGRVDLSLVFGNASGTAAEPWDAAGAGRFRFRPLLPSQMVSGSLAVSPPTVTLGTPFMTTATLWNRGTTPFMGRLRFIHKKFNYQSFDVTIPARDPVTFAPGSIEVSTSVTVPTAGKAQPFQLRLGDMLLGGAKGNVNKP